MIDEKLKIITRETCRVCDSELLKPLYSLGTQYVNNFIEKDEITKCVKAPLEMVMCGNCSLLQLKHTAPQELLYARYYWYKSGVTKTMRNALRDITSSVEKIFNLKEGDVVLDIGSNDGTFLNFFASAKTNFEFFFKTSFSNSFVLSVKKSPGLLKEQLAKKIVMIKENILKKLTIFNQLYFSFNFIMVNTIVIGIK